jgi:hypothetical protein
VIVGERIFEIIKAVFVTAAFNGAHKEISHEFEDAGFGRSFG